MSRTPAPTGARLAARLDPGDGRCCGINLALLDGFVGSLPVPVVVVHGLVGAVTLVLLLITALTL
jgi:hypothetical protein